MKPNSACRCPGLISAEIGQLSDLFINNVIYAEYYPTFTWFYEGWYWMYGTNALIVVAGIFLMKKITPQRVLLGTLTSTAVFFLVTNFMCWPGSTTYAQNFGGLMTCYVAGVPYLKGMLLGDFFIRACCSARSHGRSDNSLRYVRAKVVQLDLASEQSL